MGHESWMNQVPGAGLNCCLSFSLLCVFLPTFLCYCLPERFASHLICLISIHDLSADMNTQCWALQHKTDDQSADRQNPPTNWPLLQFSTEKGSSHGCNQTYVRTRTQKKNLYKRGVTFCQDNLDLILDISASFFAYYVGGSKSGTIDFLSICLTVK